MPRKNIELYLSIFAVSISFIAVALSWWQLEIARQHNRISLRPLLTITPYLEGPGGRNGVYLSNQGLGPATIKAMEITVGEKKFSGLGESQWSDALQQADTEPLCYKHGWPSQDAVIKISEEDILLAPTKADLPVCHIESILLQLKKNILISIEYESLYGERFTVHGSTKMNAKFPR